MLEARRTTFRRYDEKFVRITADGCVLDLDMHMLKRKDNETHMVRVLNEVKEKRFARLELGDEVWLADIVTGTLYSAKTMATISGLMQILEKQK